MQSLSIVILRPRAIIKISYWFYSHNTLMLQLILQIRFYELYSYLLFRA